MIRIKEKSIVILFRNDIKYLKIPLLKIIHHGKFSERMFTKSSIIIHKSEMKFLLNLTME